ncbi:MAG: DUF1415 domain-containing protein [Xanthomonadales bacterium]|nr:hypothetical protein [Xanthomonadales bacterium]MCC6594002.1 DUF1415 domain-containing protein [Xanthomonadales bacterium]MCE7931654.1 DUF1415 domain-containing protein [Xanthomonadales bacterium PRO6]
MPVNTRPDPLEATRRWLDRAVIGLNLCPYAKAPLRKGRVRFVLSAADSEDALVADLAEELGRLAAATPDEIETTLLVHPDVLGDFSDFNDFQEIAEATVRALGLEGELQVASFHPDFEFGDAAPGAIEHCTNHAPYPTLHLLREASIEAAVAALDDPDDIYRRNIETLRRLGRAGWEGLRRDWEAT